MDKADYDQLALKQALIRQILNGGLSAEQLKQIKAVVGEGVGGGKK